jgi:Transcription-associated recombination protein
MNKFLFKCYHGSKMYGTSNENSDTDIKGIFLPSMEDCILNKIPKQIKQSTVEFENNSYGKDDVEEQYYSLQYFLHLASESQTVALDILFSPEYSHIMVTPEMRFLIQNRSKFVTKNLTALMGYSKGQAVRYSSKGSDLKAFTELYNRLVNVESIFNTVDKMKIYNVENTLTDYARRYPEIYKWSSYKNQHGTEITKFSVYQSEFTSNSDLKFLIGSLKSKISRYGNRSKLAMDADGADFKAISHALRCVYIVQDLMTKGEFEYPLAQTDLIRKVKYSEIRFENAMDMVEDEYQKAKDLIAKSDLPEKIDMKFFEDWLISLYK